MGSFDYLSNCQLEKFEVFALVWSSTQVFWDMALRHSVSGFRRLEGRYRLGLQVFKVYEELDLNP
jgi:hypothetical protein